MSSSFLKVLLAVPVALSCRGAPEVKPEASRAQASSPIRITLVGTNDLHGWVQPHVATLGDGTQVREGGSAMLSAYLAALRADNPGGVVLVDAGDFFQGTMAANLTEGQSVVEVFNHLGYDAVAVGNHEFDYGPVGPVSTAATRDLDPFGALKARMGEAKFPLLVTNVYEAASGKRPPWLPNDGTHLLERKGVKIGLIGLVTPTTPTVTNPVNVASLRFGDLASEAVSAARRLRGRGADLVVVLAHAGGKCSSAKDPKDLSSCELVGGEIFELVQALPKGTVDAVLAGHTHSTIAHFVEGVPVIETPGLGKSFAVIELFVDPVTRKVLPERTQLRPTHPVCERVDAASGGCSTSKLRGVRASLAPASFLGKAMHPDPVVEGLLAPALARVADEQRRQLGLRAPTTLWRNYEAESALGSFLADSLREMEAADVALLNSGGLRADLGPGELTYGAVYEVLPFDNTVATLTLSGDELRRLLAVAYGARKGVFQVSGLRVKLSRCSRPDRLQSVTLADGRQIDPKARYRVVVPDFLARGGDGLGPVLASVAPNRLDFGQGRELNFRDALVAFWQRRRADLVAPKLGRVSFLDDVHTCRVLSDGHEGP